MASGSTSFRDLLDVMIKEGKRRLLVLAVIFAVVAIAVLAAGLMMPKRFDASTLLLAENTNIIKPLMEGRAVATNLSDQTAIVNQVVTSKRIMREVLAYGGWLNPPPDPKTEEGLIMKLRSRIKIDSPREELIRISYNDSDPDRTFKIANKLAEIYMRESAAGKERESREAFDFIDKQVKDYEGQLAEAHEKVLAYYRGESTAPATPTTPNAATTPRPRREGPKVNADELARLRDEEQTLMLQLQHKRAPQASSQELKQAEDQARSHVTQLQAELDRLLATYTEEHPDVRRVKRELQGAREELHHAESARQSREQAVERASSLDEQMNQAARARLEEVQRRIAAMTGSPVRSTSPRIAAVAQETLGTDPEMKNVGHDSGLSELLRKYEATRDIYQDLLKRRENARVSMELDAQHRGFTLRVQEPAEMPITATSMRLMHLSLIGLILASLVPIGILFLIVKFDPRVRTPQQIERMARVPLLVSISYNPPERDRTRHRSQTIYVALLVGGVFAIYVAAFLIRLKLSS